MIFQAISTAAVVALISLVGALFFGNTRHLVGLQRFAIPIAVGVFLSLVLYELIPETLAASPDWGGVAVAGGFIAFYVLANVLHQYYHRLEVEDCDKKSAAMLLLIGDAIHNLADGIILGGAFMIDPAIGTAVAIGLALHEIPQEIVEFGVLIRAGYTKWQAITRNLLSASSIIVGTVLVMVVAEHAEGYLWLLTGIAAGNLLFLAASELLPRIHGNLKRYGSIWHSALSIVLGFTIMTFVINYTHEQFGHDSEHDDEAGEAHEVEAEHI